MTPSRPYLLRAIYDWLLDNDMTPYMLVDATQEGVIVPQEHVQDGKIILNVSPQATNQMELGNEAVMFQARFSGRPMDVVVPVHAALAVYAKENGRGMMFPEEDMDLPPDPEPNAPDDEPTGGGNGGKRPHLTVVK